jgi:thiamine pyrophosphokinase
MKSLARLERSVNGGAPPAACAPYDFVLVLGAFGGRLDHEMQNVNTLFSHTRSSSLGRVVLLDATGWAALLHGGGGEHTVTLRQGSEGTIGADSGTCGLVPIGGPCEHVTTTGLRWNIEGSALAFGGVVSTSNEVVGERATVAMRGDDPALLWTSVFLGDAWA